MTTKIKATQNDQTTNNKSSTLVSLLLVSLLTTFSYWVYRVCASWTLAEISGSTALQGVLEAALFLPSVFITFLGGILADRFGNEKTLFWVGCYMSLVTGALAALVQIDLISPHGLILVAMLYGIGHSIRYPALTSAIVNATPPNQLKRSLALDGVMFNLGRIVGPAVAGILIVSTFSTWAFWATCLGPLGLFLYFLPKRGSKNTSPVDGQTWNAKILLNFLLKTNGGKRLLQVILFYINTNVLWALLPIYILAREDLRAHHYGILLTCFGVGAVLGGGMLVSLQSKLDTHLTILVGGILYSVSFIALASNAPLFVLYCVFGLSGACLLSVGSLLNSEFLSAIGDRSKAQGSAMFLMGANGSLAIGTLIWGFLGEFISLNMLFLMIAACVTLFAIVGLFISKSSAYV